MNWSARAVQPRKVAMFLAAAFVGLGIGTLGKAGAVTLPLIGTAPSLVVGGAALVVGAGTFTALKQTGSGCGCGDGCDC